MDLESIAAWGELLGGIGGVVAAFVVFVTLLYLARQVQQNTAQMRAEIAHGVMTALRDQFEPLKTAEGAELYYRGMSGLGNLTATESFQFHNISAGYFRVFEEAYFHHKAERLEDVYWDVLSGQLELVLKIPGVREEWGRLGDHYSHEFTAYGDSLLRERQ